MRGTCQGIKGQHVEACRAEKQIDHAHQRHTAHQRAREVPLRLLHFGADEVQVFPAVISPQPSGQRCQEGADGSQSQRGWDHGLEIGFVSVPERKSENHYGEHRGDLDQGQRHLHLSAEPHAQVVDERDHSNGDHGQRLRPRKRKIVGLAHPGQGDMPGEKWHGHRWEEKSPEPQQSGSDRSG